MWPYHAGFIGSYAGAWGSLMRHNIRIWRKAILVHQRCAILKLVCIMDNREGAMSERAIALSSKIGQEISNPVTFTFDMSEGDRSVVLKPVANPINLSSQAPTVSHFVGIGPP